MTHAIPIRRPVLFGRRYAAEAVSLFARMATQPDATRLALIDATIRSLIAGGVWAKLDSLYVMAAHDSQAARLNWVANESLTAYNSPAFTVDRGFKGDGASAYLTGPLTSAKQSQNDAMILVGVQLWGGSGGVDFLSDWTRQVANPTRSRINDSTYYDWTPQNTGRFYTNRSGASSRQMYRNGDLVASDAVVSLGSGGSPLLFGVLATYAGASPCLDRIHVIARGGSMTATEIAAFDAALSNYATTVGA